MVTNNTSAGEEVAVDDQSSRSPIGVPYLGRTELTQYFGHLAGQSSRGSELTSRAAPPWLSLRSSAWQSAVARLGCRQTAHQAPPRWTITASTPLAHRLSRADGHLSGTGSRHKPAPPARNRRRGSGTVARRARGRPRRAAPACTSRGRVARSQLKLAWSPPPACCVTQSAYVLRVVHPHCVAECAGQRRILVEPSLLLDRPGRASPVQPLGGMARPRESHHPNGLWTVRHPRQRVTA